VARKQPDIRILWNVTDKDVILSDDPNVIKWGFSPKATTAWNILQRPEVRGICIGGAKGGSKTYSISRWLMMLSWLTMKRYGLKPQRDQKAVIPIGFFCRRRFVPVIFPADMVGRNLLLLW